jgi:exonuclease SbcC
MDLLKYQVSLKASMEQLFFITCDDRISKLLKYKLSGRGIELRELLEADFV